MNRRFLTLGCLVGSFFLCSHVGAAEAITASQPTGPAGVSVELVATVLLDGSAHDLSGDRGRLEDGSAADQFGGLSAMEYTGEGNRFLLLADRGAGDGEVTYRCRFHEAELIVDAEKHTIRCELISTRMISTPDGQPVVGSIAADEAHLVSTDPNHQWTALDLEGLRRLPDGSLLLSDEYGPHVLIADPSGRVKEEYPVPEKFLRRPRSEGGFVTRGVAYNRGLEGIAITPSGTCMLAMPQSPLVQDSVQYNGMSLGVNCRCIVYGANRHCEREVVYTMDNDRNGLSEVLAIDEDRFLVIERDGKAGREAKEKKIYLADLRGATDVCDIDSLPESGLPDGVVPMKKTLLIDLLDPRFGLGGDHAKEKAEGLCWGPRLPDGRQTLWVCYDNDFESSIQTEFDCFAVTGLGD
ncbi:esterase-like activity of phytase family protein [Aporhodopirellula aestuarii]|uniref:Esterase-like activity of phytase family protein n=1 Tax=Aporhodopirellula aestuarii TaxID=2950107 RepID=A0ABT0U1V2_9BACT|nr:esterase-like activity of phytase family protein [Aporhodopirellula aestuarii]MCM2370882.1 esterase-like activity of phytase family protein [Aporhodopirellula aestuarii]